MGDEQHGDDIRVSDHDRQAVVDRLSRATGEGLLTLDEFADAAGLAYAAITRSQLDSVTRDLQLPVLAPMPTPAPSPQAAAQPTEAPPKRRWIVAIMSGEERKGKWRCGRRTGAFALMGGVELDLRSALLEGDEIEITAWAIMGGVSVIVPEGIPVESSGFILMGGRSNRIKDVPPVPGAPTIRVKGFGMWGGVDVRSKSAGEERGRHEHDHHHDRQRRIEERRDRAVERANDMAERALEQARRHLEHLPPPPAIPVPPLPGISYAPAHAPAPVPHDEPRAERPADPVPDPPTIMPGGLVTIVSTDIVGSTRYANTLGDQRWRGVLQAHNALVREQLTRHGGHEVKTSGDGFLVTFSSARRALQFSVDVQEALATYRAGHPDTPLEVRIGVHAGEVERDGIDVVGRNVTLACRLCDAAAPGEILASAVVAELADSASDLAFGDLREHQLAGFERPILARPASRR